MTARPDAPPSPASDRGVQLYVAAFSCTLYLVLLIAPVVGGALTTRFGLSPSLLGLLFSLELGAFSLATIPAYLWLRRVNLRTATYVCLAVVVGGNVVSGLLDSYPALVVARVVTALAAGSITVIVLSLSGRTGDPGRTFGIFVACQLVMGAITLAVFPVLFAGAPVAAIYWTLAGLTALCLPVVRLIDGEVLRAGPAAPTGPAARVRPWAFVLGLAAVLLFYMSLSGVWTFMEAIGTASGVAPGTTALVLSVATFAGIAPAVIASVVGDTPRRMLFLATGYTAMALSVGLLLGGPGVLRFAIAAVVFKFAWTFILPYLLSALSDLGGGGQVMNTTNLMIGTGFAIGPVLGGVLIEGTGGFGAMLTVSFLGVVASGAAVLSARPTPSPAPAPAPA